LSGSVNNNKEGNKGSNENGETNYEIGEDIVDNNNVEKITAPTNTHNYQYIECVNDCYSFTCQDETCEKQNISFTAKCDSGTNCISVTDNKVSFLGVTKKTIYYLSGEFYGAIEIDVGDDYKFELHLNGFTLTSDTLAPINVKSGDKCTIAVESGTQNYIYDIREEVTEDEDISSSVYSSCDLVVSGEGSLDIKSVNNNGIHGKDDLTVKEVNLQVESVDNSLKGNDGVTIESGKIVLISTKGDGIKTTNSHISSKGKQKGDIKISGGEIIIYSACDGIDASHDIAVLENANLQIFTDKYSKFSEEVTAVADEKMYVKNGSTTYKYSLEFSNSTSKVWCNSSSYEAKSNMGGDPRQNGGTQYYYSITKPSGYTKVRLFVYSSSQEQGQETNYVYKTDYLTLNSNYDTLAIDNRGGSLGVSWTNYSTQNNIRAGGMGGMQEGNTDKGDYSTKGLKADNTITISGGDITISSYDDAIHTNNDVELGEEGAYYYGTGNITISAGNLVLCSNDDGVHADGVLQIDGGNVTILKSYEGLEGNSILISGGEVAIKSNDDGINATTENEVGISISGGTLYVYAGGDGLDSNSKTSYSGFVISGGKTIVISTGNADSALDSENGYAYTGGYVVAIGRSGGMNSEESVKCSNFNSVGSSKSLSLNKDSLLVVDSVATIKMPTSINSFVVVLGKTNASISTANSVDKLAGNGVLWNV